MASLYEIPIEKIKGIGTARAKRYRFPGTVTVGALVSFLPASYEVCSCPVPIADAQVGQTVCVRACVSTAVSERMLSGGRLLAAVRVSDSSGYMRLVFFNNRYIKSMLTYGDEYIFYGKVTDDNGVKSMASPSFEKFDGNLHLRPIYHQTAGLTSRQIEASVKKALAMLPEIIKDPIPLFVRERSDIINLKDALNQIHFPKSKDEANAARKRLIFEELLTLVLGLNSMKSAASLQTSVRINEDCTEEFLQLLPFKLTAGQMGAIRDGIADMTTAGGKTMNRLVQGDVGSGKTMVALALAFTAVRNNYQAAMMVPTEILARQHYHTISQLFEPAGIRVRLLTGSATAKEKREVLDGLATGLVDFVIGTHALISANVEFAHLGLVITDEQHRFGVRQRGDLLLKGDNPHLLVMSATPIPRTLALIIYGDLDISLIHELPPGRKQVDTFLIDAEKRNRAYNFLIKNIEEGRQCYIVCPSVENTDDGLVGVEEYAQKISAGIFKGYRVEFIHGKLKTSEKDNIMARFLDGQIDVLVSTTVIEVGVDVPNAAIMMIENAERFGLSQLHQLRGRVGRGEHKSYCILVSDTKGDDARKRLGALCSTNDGFVIAEEDLKLRGPGDFFGSRQHGLPELKISSLADNMDLLVAAQSSAKELLYCSPDLSDKELRGLRAEIRMLFGDTGKQLN